MTTAMTAHKIAQISSAGKQENNEDLIATYRSEGITDIVIMDGGTSVADRNYVDTGMGDVVWFVRTFALSLEEYIRPDRTPEQSVRLALKDVRTDFHQKTSGIPVPHYAYPIAAMTWIRIQEVPGSVTLQIYSLGDCKTFLRTADGSVTDLDPYENPQELVIQGEISRLTEEGITDGAARRERLLPMLRARREFQNSDPSPSVLCLDPQGPFSARRHTVQADHASMLLAMTDGFYRIVDTYKIHSIEKLATKCAQEDLESIMKELRDFESASRESTGLVIKSTDDASAVTCAFS